MKPCCKTETIKWLEIILKSIRLNQDNNKEMLPNYEDNSLEKSFCRGCIMSADIWADIVKTNIKIIERM